MILCFRASLLNVEWYLIDIMLLCSMAMADHCASSYTSVTMDDQMCICACTCS